MPIEVTTVYHPDLMYRYQRSMGPSTLSVILICAICSFIGLMNIVLMAAIGEDMTFAIGCMVFFLVLSVLGLFMTFGLPRIAAKKTPKAVIRYAFYLDGFSFSAANDHGTESAANRYSIVTKVIKNGSDLYLLISNIQAFIVDLSSLSPAQVAQLHSILQTHLPAKKIKWKD